MASIIERNDKWFVRVRKHGQPSQSKTFTIKTLKDGLLCKSDK